MNLYDLKKLSGSTNDSNLKAGITLIVVALVSLPFTVLLNAFVFFKLWNWLLVPILFVPVLTLLQSFALSVFFSFVTLPLSKSELSSENKCVSDILSRLFGSAFIVPSFLLLVGYIVHLFL